ncbi:GNAT family N-acetyltransferase [Salinibacterium sp. ZJ450]|uniref:GNAT family N-acetyltransferase n=1 Tax=Salinibacterium sp. ZJ450 TaxID=2708338 RepID=UPI00141EC3DD|nr:GNAT family protein [Salinibacterium sp. ZJ450]
MAATRLISTDDAARLSRLLQANREFLAPWEPLRGEQYFTEPGQQADAEAALERYDRGEAIPHVILDEGGQVIGRITLSGIVRGPFQSCSLGYWLASEYTGRGFATAAARELTTLAFDSGLHRVEAGTLVDNVRSQRVLERVGFTRFGLAPEYLNIAGRWQDHVMFQLLSDHREPL